MNWAITEDICNDRSCRSWSPDTTPPLPVTLSAAKGPRAKHYRPKVDELKSRACIRLRRNALRAGMLRYAQHDDAVGVGGNAALDRFFR
jgi:hypothetical protein